jgi:ferric-dicitrate binding protein FerR (iron transport regulator)
MSTNNSRLQYLVSKYLDDTCTPDELAEFWQLIGDLKDETPMQAALQNLWQQSKAGNDTPAMGWAQVLQTIYDKASPALVEQAEIIPLHKRPVIRWAAAAVIVLSLGTAAYWLFNNKPAGSTGVVATTTPIQDVQAPQNNRATITLANGKTVYLDSAANGSLATQSNVQLIKLADGQIAYKGAASELVYNTLTNPRGSKVIDMTLSDGSRIWLNAGSSITYPVTFVGKERNVEISGEVYLEVAHNAARPFRVRHGATEVQVLGTHFNINAYDDEPAVKVTLLEGSVKVGNNKGLVTIKPGEQATIASNQLPNTSGNINLEQVMAWKNGLFSFTGADLTTVMRQLARWYNIQVKYEGQIPARKFSGEITHDLTLSQLMNGLQSLGIQFSIEGRTMIVQQK